MKRYPVYMRKLGYGFILRIEMCGGKVPPEKYYEPIGEVEADSKRDALRVISKRIKDTAPQDNEVKAYTILWHESCVRVSVIVRKSTWHGNHQVIGYLHAKNQIEALDTMEGLMIGAMGGAKDVAW